LTHKEAEFVYLLYGEKSAKQYWKQAAYVQNYSSF